MYIFIPVPDKLAHNDYTENTIKAKPSSNLAEKLRQGKKKPVASLIAI